MIDVSEIKLPTIKKPSHQAPIHRGSEEVITEYCSKVIKEVKKDYKL